MPFVESLIKAVIFSILELSNTLMSFVEQFPRRIQITLGGKPNNETKLLKSLSLGTTVNHSFLAKSHTIESRTFWRLISDKCLEPVNEVEKKEAILGNRFWSKRSFIILKVQFFLYSQQNLNKPKYLPFPGKENHLVFHQNSSRRQDNLKRMQQLCASLLRMVFQLFYRAQELFYQLTVWHFVLSEKYENIAKLLMISDLEHIKK